MAKINKSTATKEVDEFIKSLGIREHKLEKLKEHRQDLISMLMYGIISITEKGIKYVLEEPFDDETKELLVVKKRYTVEEADAMAKAFEGDQIEKALGVMGMMCEPIQPSSYMMQLKEGFTDLNAIAAFFLPV